MKYSVLKIFSDINNIWLNTGTRTPNINRWQKICMPFLSAIDMREYSAVKTSHELVLNILCICVQIYSQSLV